MPQTLLLTHPVHGVVQKWKFDQLNDRKDTKCVLKIIDRWRKKYGKKYLECETKWEGDDK